MEHRNWCKSRAGVYCNCNLKTRQLFQKILDKATPQISKSPKKNLTGWWVLNLHDKDINLIKGILNETNRT